MALTHRSVLLWCAHYNADTPLCVAVMHAHYNGDTPLCVAVMCTYCYADTPLRVTVITYYRSCVLLWCVHTTTLTHLCMLLCCIHTATHTPRVRLSITILNCMVVAVFCSHRQRRKDRMRPGTISQHCHNPTLQLLWQLSHVACIIVLECGFALVALP